jgi:hypothetical protein
MIFMKMRKVRRMGIIIRMKYQITLTRPRKSYDWGSYRLRMASVPRFTESLREILRVRSRADGERHGATVMLTRGFDSVKIKKSVIAFGRGLRREGDKNGCAIGKRHHRMHESY